MKLRMLTGDNIDGIGWTLSDRLSEMGFDVKYCSNMFSVLEAECARYKPDGLVFFIMAEREGLYEFTERMIGNYPEMKIFVLSYVTSYGVREKLERLGIAGYFLMPETPRIISKYIYRDMVPAEERLFRAEISDYLETRGVYHYCTGYSYLCLAVDCCINDISLSSRITGGLYPAIAEKVGATPQSVEIMLRRYSRYLAKLGIKFEDYTGKYPMRNSKLIKTVLGEFLDMYPEFRNDKPK